MVRHDPGRGGQIDQNVVPACVAAGEVEVGRLLQGDALGDLAQRAWWATRPAGPPRLVPQCGQQDRLAGILASERNRARTGPDSGTCASCWRWHPAIASTRNRRPALERGLCDRATGRSYERVSVRNEGTCVLPIGAEQTTHGCPTARSWHRAAHAPMLLNHPGQTTGPRPSIPNFQREPPPHQPLSGLSIVRP